MTRAVEKAGGEGQAGRVRWMEEKGACEESKEYRERKLAPAWEEYVDDSEGARVRMLLRCGSLPLRGGQIRQMEGGGYRMWNLWGRRGDSWAPVY